MEKFHVHVYETLNMAEVDVEAQDEQAALAMALQMVKDGTAMCDQPSPTQHLAFAFPGGED